MKKLLMPIGFFLLVLTSAIAQQQQGVEAKNKIHQRHEKIAKELNLSKEQQQKMKSIHQDFNTKVKNLKSNDNLTMGDFKKQIKALHQQKESQVKSILNAEQQAKLDELKTKRKHHKKEMNT